MIQHKFKTINLKEFDSVALKNWLTNHIQLINQIPDIKFKYTTQRPNDLRILGTQLVNHMIQIGPISCQEFNKIMKPSEQTSLLKYMFKLLKNKHIEAGTGFGSKGKPGYFFTNRNFSLLIPEGYKRSLVAPRVTSITPNALHGMKKEFQVANLQMFTSMHPQYIIFEIDLSACHSRIAASFLNEGNPLELSLKDPNFWKTEVAKFLPDFQKANPKAEFSTIKGILKAFLYTSLNGGNPASKERVDAVLSTKAKHLLDGYAKPMFDATTSTANKWELVSAVKSINKTCFVKSETNPNNVLVHCLENLSPYKLPLDKSYCSISRILQSFEVVLLSVLIGASVSQKLLPLSLEHDGILAIGSRSDLSAINFEETKMEFEAIFSSLLEPWSTCLLHQPMPVVLKRIISEGKVVVF